jgi:hypothetical protein
MITTQRKSRSMKATEESEKETNAIEKTRKIFKNRKRVMNEKNKLI